MSSIELDPTSLPGTFVEFEPPNCTDNLKLVNEMNGPIDDAFLLLSLQVGKYPRMKQKGEVSSQNNPGAGQQNFSGTQSELRADGINGNEC